MESSKSSDAHRRNHRELRYETERTSRMLYSSDGFMIIENLNQDLTWKYLKELTLISLKTPTSLINAMKSFSKKTSSALC